MNLVKKYLLRYRRHMLVGFVFVVLTNITSLLAPWVLKFAVDSLRVGADGGMLVFYAVLILGIAIFQGIFRFFMRRILIGISRNIEYHLRMNIFDHVQKLPLEFFQINRTGDLLSRATSDLNNVRLFLGPGIMNLMSTVILFATAIIFMASINPVLMLYSMAPLPLATLLMFRASSLFHKRYRKMQEANARMSSHAQENFSGIRVVKAYVQEDNQTEAFRKLNEDYRRQNLHLARLFGFFHPMIGFIMGLTTIIILWAGGRMIINGVLSLGDLVAFLGFMSLLIWPTVALGWVISLFQRGTASAERIKWILDTEPSIHDADQPVHVDRISGSISIRNLSFTYPGMSEPSLKNIDLDIQPGRKVAVVGRTGSGKTTLVSLIPRQYTVTDGHLLIDGVPVEHIPLALLRGSIGFVPQETFLFSETIEKNIGLGTGIRDFPIEDAARLAGMQPDLDTFPSGFQTMIGERGITLSGGQKQRTALARAIIRDPRILVLDDAFSSVDAQTEKTILGNLKHLMAGRTTIIITHRLSSIADADMIVVLDKGTIVERGTHQELIARDGHYARMYHRQSIIEELEKEDRTA